MSSSIEMDRSRRRLLRNLAQGGAAIGTIALLPDRWTRPVIDAVVVPLHAQTSAPLIDPATLAGNWTGSWTDTVAGTGGAATMTVTVNTGARTFLVLLDLDGPVFGGPDPIPQSMTGSYNLTGATICCQVVSWFGIPTVTISPAGVITGSFAPLPENGSVQVAGTVSATALVINYTATPARRRHAGTLTLTKL